MSAAETAFIMGRGMPDEEETYSAHRREMVELQLRQRGIYHPELLAAFAELPRHLFMPPGRRGEAYADYPVPIGHGQTISQPYVVALMVQELDPGPQHKVLDVGAGSGYQTAVLARLAGHVYAVERIGELTERAVCALAGLNIANVTLSTLDGSMGWPEEAPFDRIICGAAAPEIPQPWIDQLADGGRIVLPVGGTEVQSLRVVDKHGGKTHSRDICDVRFVRLIGKWAWPG
jgi:protein-L-isoaspartate(D-aspartate) O-methyltransferase